MLLLSTDVGQLALIDERVRVVEAFGGTVTDAEYAALQAPPPWWIYFTSGSRLLLSPATTVADGARRVGGRREPMVRQRPLSQALAVAVAASVVLLIGQLVATPLHYVRESLTSPLNLAAVLPLMEEGTLPARFFGTMDLFAMWWAGLLATGPRPYSPGGGRAGTRGRWPRSTSMFAAVMAAITAAMGGA